MKSFLTELRQNLRMEMSFKIQNIHHSTQFFEILSINSAFSPQRMILGLSLYTAYLKLQLNNSFHEITNKVQRKKIMHA